MGCEMFDKYYQECSTEEKMELLVWELESLALKSDDDEMRNLALQMKIKFWEKKFGTTLQEFIQKQSEERISK